MSEACSLCNQKRDLRASHIIPKFVGKWLKDTSATGFMRSAEKPEKRAQDLPTLQLLCSECEERFSKLEMYFSKKIFFPFHKKRIQSFEYDERLELFVVSLSWRTLKMNYDDWKRDKPQLRARVDKAENDWRDFLLGKRQSIKPYENHIIFLDYVKSGTSDTSNLQWYTLRATDATLVGNGRRIMAYTKFPWMVFVTSIHPTTLEGWIDTKIRQKGTVATPQQIKDGSFGQFLMNRADFVFSRFSSSSTETVNKRVFKAIAKDPIRFLESDDFEIMIAEEDHVRSGNMKFMPESVKALVRVIVDAVDDPSKSKSDNRWARSQTRKIADVLSNLSNEESLALDTLVLSAIRESATLRCDARITLETKRLWITFIVNPSSTKEYQRSMIVTEMERLKQKRGEQKVPLVIFSMNPSDKDVSFETGFLID